MRAATERSRRGAPADVCEALATHGLHAQSFSDITALPLVGRERASYRVELTNGGIVKVRRLESEAVATDLDGVLHDAPAIFTKPLFRHRRMIVEPWIEGTPLNELPCQSEYVVIAAQALADLHCADVPGLAPEIPIEPMVARFRDGLRQLVEVGELQVAEARHLEHRVHLAGDPQLSPAGLSHSDLCAENMILDRDGALHVIDNEHVGVRPYIDRDLARVRYRWPMSDVHRREFDDTYRARRQESGRPFPIRDNEDSIQRLWDAVVLVGSAALRLKAPEHLLRGTVEQLRSMAALAC